MSFIIQPAAGGATITATASGAIAANTPCVVNANGTVSAVGLSLITGYTATSSQGSTPQAATGALTGFGGISTTYDSTNQKLIVAYLSQATNYINVKVGSLSGNNCTWGTAVVPESITLDNISVTYDAGSGKVIVAGVSGTFGKVAYVGTVSGTSISFGSRAVIDSNTTNRGLELVYDSTNQKTVAIFGNASNLQSAVGTVSGTSISFGAVATFGAFVPPFAVGIRAAFDASQGKIVTVIPNSSTNLQAFVGTVSGTTISFGSGTVIASGNFNGGTGAPMFDVTYDASAQRIIVAEMLDSTGNARAYVATISGTSISFTSPVTYFTKTGGHTSYAVSIAYNSTDQATVFLSCSGSGIGSQSFKINTALLSGTTLTFQYGTTSNPTVSGNGIGPSSDSVYEASQNKVAQIANSGTSNPTNQENVFITLTAVAATNLTSENFIGFSSDVYSNGATATIEIIGNINDGQTSLTPGQSYYVQSAGGIGLSPSSPSVFAGTAYTASKLIIKG